MLKNLGSKFIRLILFHIILFLCIVSHPDFQGKSFRKWLALPEKSVIQANPVLDKIISDNYPDAVLEGNFLKKESMVSLKDNKGEIIGYSIITAPFCQDILGYAGNVPVIVFTDPEKQIEKIEIYGHSESPGFINRIKSQGFFERFLKLKLNSDELKKIDTVSGATMTTSAVIRSLRKRASFLEPADKIQPEYYNLKKWGETIFVALILFYLTRKKRIYLLIVSVLFTGFYRGYSLSISWFYNFCGTGINLLIHHPFSLFIFCSAIFLPLLKRKPYWCLYFCPYGCAQELIGKITKKKRKIPSFIQPVFNILPDILLGIIILLTFLGMITEWTDYEPFSGFSFQTAPQLSLGIFGVFLFMSLFLAKPWCRFFCPTGALVRYISKFMDTIDPKENKMRTSDFIAITLSMALLLLVAKPYLPKDFSWMKCAAQTSGKDTMSVIYSRKSVRNYQDKPLTQEILTNLIKAGMAAPTAADKRPWQFISVLNKETLSKLAEGLEYGKMIPKAGGAIIVCGDISLALPGMGAGYWIQDCSAATQNILLAAESMDLGAVWVGAFPLNDRVEHIRTVLGLPKTIVPLNVISIGYPSGNEKPKDKYQPEKIHKEKW